MKRRRKWLRWLRRRRDYRYLRATGIRAWAAIGPKRTIYGLLAAVAGGVLNVDFGFAVTVFIAALFAYQWLVLTPSEMWDESERERKDHAKAKEPAPATVVHVHPGATYVGSQTITPEAVSSSGFASREGPRSPRTSKRDPKPPPPSLGL